MIATIIESFSEAQLTRMPTSCECDLRMHLELNTRISSLLRSYPGLSTFDTDLVYESVEKDGTTRKVKIRSPSGDVLESVSQVIVPALQGLVKKAHLETLTDHLEANHLALRSDLDEADLRRYDRLTMNWMRGYAALNGKFNVSL